MVRGGYVVWLIDMGLPMINTQYTWVCGEENLKTREMVNFWTMSFGSIRPWYITDEINFLRGHMDWFTVELLVGGIVEKAL